MECTHEVQFNGLCAICGAILDSNDKTHINMSHDNSGITVSRKEAERLELESTERLLKSRKLSLILDLDQTVVHATWDPTVGDWMNDKNNANHPATKDIRKFSLPGSPLIYYIKMRPGLSEFLQEIGKLYELHIYTMGTRHYAEAVAREIDPTNRLFSDRVLSRDESGSLTQKKLQRLFPCDTSMVVVLDDRPDVWNFSPNLIKIKPYEFFVGIGDINSPFAPKQIPEAPTVPKAVTESGVLPSTKTDAAEGVEKDTKNDDPSENNGVTDDQDDDDEEEETKELAETTVLQLQEKAQEEMAKEQQQQRPLAQKQNELAPEQDRPLLVDDDRELYTMLKILKEVHQRFYESWDAAQKDKKSAGTQLSDVKPDVTKLIPAMKLKVLQGIKVVFSGVIPLQQEPQTSWVWQLAESFGAECLLELTGKVTHLIAARAGTSKVKAARNTGSIKIVTPAWLFDSTSRWAIQDESEYALVGGDEVENPESTPLDLEDGAFDNDEHALVENIDWEEADREVEDFMNESGTDFGDTDSEALERSPLHSSAESRKGKRRRDDDDDDNDDTSEDDDSVDIPRSPLAKRRMTTAQRGRSHLSQVTMLETGSSSDSSNPWDNESGQEEEQEDRDDESESADGQYESSSSLDDFAGLLDEEIE